MRDFTIEDMRHFALEAWGELGGAVVDRWRAFNAAYFGGALQPIPIVITHVLPFGKRLAFCSHGNGRTITLNVPQRYLRLVADNNTLLHEMVHQLLFERGEDPAHMGAPWLAEVMAPLCIHARKPFAD